jgi:GAF domain-containing protein
MAFTGRLGQSLDVLDRQVDVDSRSGRDLESILDRYLLEIEQSADSDIQTSILLLDRDHGRLLHGAAPSLPKAYCKAIDGIAIGPSVGSCGTAAFVGHAIFVTDIATDPLWDDFRDLALSHDLRSCWSTPIRSDDNEILGTFAIYHSVARAPTEDEIMSVKDISGRVARAITGWSNRSRV